MVTVIFGQPHSGKTTLAGELRKIDWMMEVIDGDALRETFKNSDYSRQGRIKNLNRASEIATYLNSTNIDVILSLVYPYKECRDYLKSLVPEVKWVYLEYEKSRGRENLHVLDFESPDEINNLLRLNTDEFTIETCAMKIMKYIKFGL